MTRVLRLAYFAILVFFLGCSFNRADFVAGPDGKAQSDQMSDDGKTVQRVLKNGPRVGFEF
jgi:hypothetical protein